MYLYSMWIILTILFKVFETALFGNLKFIATYGIKDNLINCEEVDLWTEGRVNLQRVNGGSVRTVLVDVNFHG